MCIRDWYCSSPIDTDQVYCSNKCWVDSREKEPTESALKVWASIIGVLLLLFALLLAVFSIMGDSEFGLPVSTFLSGLIVYFILKEIYNKDQFQKLFSFPELSESLRVIATIIVLDVFIVLPISIVITLLFFPDAEQQEVVTMFEEASDISIAILAFSVAILSLIHI